MSAPTHPPALAQIPDNLSQTARSQLVLSVAASTLLTMEGKLLLVAEVADILRCSVSTVYSLLESGKLLGHRCPGWRVKPADLEAYIESTRKEPQAPTEGSRDPLLRLKHIRL